MNDDRLPKIVLLGEQSRAKRKAVHRPRTGWEEVARKYLREIGTSWEGVKREDLNILGWRRSVIGLRQLGTGVCCSNIGLPTFFP